jgi:hypothetical protein
MLTLTIRRASLTLALFATLSFPTVAHGQTVTGRVLEQGSERPINGAMVILLDAAGNQQNGSLTGDEGEFTIRAAAPGSYTLRVQRIGFRDTDTPTFPIGAGESVRRTIQVAQQAIELEGITARARRRCEIRPADGQAISTLWNEARKALEIAQYTERNELYGFRIRRHRRVLEPQTLRVQQDSTRLWETVGSTSPFQSPSIERLFSVGFVEVGDQGAEFHAPDAAVLLSDEFLDAHCLRLAADSPLHPELIGLAFEPAGRAGPPMLRGTLWLNRESFRLSHLEFGYARSDLAAIGGGRVGGRVEFESLPSGAWFVRRWWIRMPEVQQQYQAWRQAGQRQENVLVAISEVGGEIVELLGGGGRQLLVSQGAVLTGAVVDSLTGRPLDGATVYLSGTVHSTVTDADGRFTLADLPQGEYGLTYWHDLLSELGLAPGALAVTLRPGETLTAEMAIPAALHLAALEERCRARAAPLDRRQTRILRGRLRDELTGEPLADARVTLSWNRFTGGVEIRENRTSISLVTDAAGRYLVCGLPEDRPVSLLVERDQARETVVLGELAEPLTERDVTLRYTQPGRLALHLVDWEGGQPVRDATVSVPELGLSGISDRNGRVVFAEVAPGTHRVAVRHLAAGTLETEVEVARGGSEVQLRLPTQAIALEGIEVTVLSQRETARRAGGTAQNLLTRTQIEQRARGVRDVGDLAANNFPGIIVRDVHPTPGMMRTSICIGTHRPTALGETDCNVAVILDGIRINDNEILLTINPREIESIEYLSAAEAGPLYGTGTAGGVLIIYTRGQGPWAERGRP